MKQEITNQEQTANTPELGLHSVKPSFFVIILKIFLKIFGRYKYELYIYNIKITEKHNTMKNSNINATESQIEKANAMFAKCHHMTFERHLEIIVKQDSKKGWQKATKKDAAKQASRENVANMKEVHLTVDGVDYGSDIASYNTAMARKMMNIR